MGNRERQENGIVAEQAGEGPGLLPRRRLVALPGMVCHFAVGSLGVGGRTGGRCPKHSGQQPFVELSCP